ncbi:MAG: lipase family alpha/beta hydrolase [Rhizobacter sp.]|jgi:triacylglycerol lipase
MPNWIARALALVATATLAWPLAAQAQSASTRHPIVLVHGLFGFDSAAIIGDYFNGIVGDLRRNGARVYVPEVAAVNSNEVRGEQLLRQLRQYQALYGHTKFNLVGHSQGGTTVRYVAGVAPELVASVSTVGTPHGGSPVADAMMALGIDKWGSPLAKLIQFLAGNSAGPQDIEAVGTALSTRGAAAFNNRFPLGRPTSSCGSGPATANGIAFYSVSGTSVATNVFDVSDALMLATSVFFLGAQNDGLVGRCSSHWGTVLKDNYRWNHLDEVNQVGGLRGLFAEDPVAFYRSHANRLKNAGL